MSLKVSVYIAMSLDGFIARLDGSIDWLEQANLLVPQGQDLGYRGFIDSVDTLVMGRYSFEKVLTFTPWPYPGKRVVVLSQNQVAIPKELGPMVSHSSESPNDLIIRLKSEGAKHLYVDGGVTIQRFLSSGLINELTITTIPILIGEGKRLFGPIQNDLSLKHGKTQAFDFGFVQSKYHIQA